MRGRALLQALELLQAALRLAGLARLVAEAVDEGADLAHPRLLLLVHRPAEREGVRALSLEGAVVAPVAARVPALQVHHVGGDAVQEVAVVGDDEGGAVPVLEPVLEPQGGIEVEVVGGLVEEQQVRAAHQSLREVQPDPPAARELADGPRQIFGIEPETIEDSGRARLRGVRVDRLELRVEQRQPVLVATLLGLLDRALGLAQRPVTVDRPFERAHRA